MRLSNCVGVTSNVLPGFGWEFEWHEHTTNAKQTVSGSHVSNLVYRMIVAYFVVGRATEARVRLRNSQRQDLATTESIPAATKNQMASGVDFDGGGSTPTGSGKL